MHARLRSLIFAFGCLALLPLGASAQEADTTQLPEIAPQEIEIRGEREIALPSLERQPLTGFATPPTLPTVPTDRPPYIEPHKQELDDLPESLPLPETVAAPLQPTPDPAQGFVEGGGGRYVTRFLEGRLIAPVSAHELVSVHGAYTGMEGFAPFSGRSVETPSDIVHARVRFESRRDPIRLDADVHGSAERYLLYGTTPNPGNAVRDGYSAGTSVQVQSQGSVPGSATVAYDRTEYTSDLAASGTGSDLVFSQDALSVQGTVTVPTTLQPHLDVAYSHSWLGGDPGRGTAYGADGTGTLSFFQTDSTALEVGATVLAFDTPAQPAMSLSTRETATYVVPYVSAEWQISEGAILHVQNRPRRVEASLHDLYAENPFAMHAPSLRPTLETTNAEAGLTFTAGPVRMVAAGGFRYAPTYRYFEPGSQGRYTSGVFQVRYGSARIIQGRGQIALQGVEGVQASLGFSVRDGSLGSGNTTIPNFAPVTADAMLTVSFADGRGFLEAQSHFASPRYATRAENNRLDSYATLGLEGGFEITSNIEVVARIENIAPDTPTFWAGYPRPPAQISTGLRIQW